MLHIYTPSGDHYLVNERGEIAKYGNQFSGDWKLIGIGRVNSHHVSHCFAGITPEVVDKLDLRYKNGKPRYTVHDLDHGTHRVWGNTQYHGISSMWFE